MLIVGKLLLMGVAYVTGRLLYREPPEEAHEPEPPPEEDTNNRLVLATVGVAAAAGGVLVAPALNTIALGCVVYNAWPLVKESTRALQKEGRLTIELMDLIAIIVSLYARLLILAATTEIVYVLAVKALAMTRRQAEEELGRVLAERPEHAWVVREGAELQIPLTDLKAGDIVSVRAGELVPVDGEVVEGLGSVDQCALTGEALPEDKGVGDAVFGSTLLTTGRLHVRVTHDGGVTLAQNLEQVIAQTTRYEATLLHQNIRLADATVGPNLGVGAVALLGLGPRAAMAVLSSNYMDLTMLNTPLAMLSYLRLASRSHLLIRDGRSLELAGDVDTVVFDKTGTLTLDRFIVKRILAVGVLGEDEALRLAAAAEGRHMHPIARAIVELAQARGLAAGEPDQLQSMIGSGVGATIGGARVLVGSTRLMTGSGIPVPGAVADEVDAGLARGRPEVYVAVDGRLEAVIELEPILRPGVAELVQRLQASGHRVYLLSGDHETPTRTLAEQLGADGWFAEVLPEEKGAVVQRLQEEGHQVCFVGDGINDAIALRRARLSVSLRGASGLAVNSAQVVLLRDRLDDLEHLFRLGKDYTKDQRLVLPVTFGPSLLSVAGVFLFSSNLITATLLYYASAGVAVAIGLSPMWRRDRSKDDVQPGGDAGGTHSVS